MATSDAPLNVPNVTLAVARVSSSAGVVSIAGSGFGSLNLNEVSFTNTDLSYVAGNAVPSEFTNKWRAKTDTVYTGLSYVSEAQRGIAIYANNPGQNTPDGKANSTLSLDIGRELQYGEKIFFSYRQRIKPNAPSGEGIGQHKVFRIQGTETVSGGDTGPNTPMVVLYNWNKGSAPSGNDSPTITAGPSSTSATISKTNGIDKTTTKWPQFNNQWHRVDVEIEIVSPGADRAELYGYYDSGVSVRESLEFGETGSNYPGSFDLYPSIATSKIRYLVFQNFFGNGEDPTNNFIDHGAEIWMDSVYLGVGLSRLELCNSADYASATKFEIQKPGGWSDSEVSIPKDQIVWGEVPSPGFLHVIVNGASVANKEVTL